MSPIKMNRRTALKSIAGASGIALGSLGSVPSLAVEKTSKVRAAKNLVLIVNVLGYNKRTFYPPGDDLDKSPLLSRLSKHHGRLTMFRGMRQPSIIGGHGGDKGMLTCNYNQPNGQYISLDQFIGERIEQQTRFKTVHMGDKTLVWGKDSRPLNTLMERGPRHGFDHLFSATPTDELKRELEGVRIGRKGIPSAEHGGDAYARALDEREQELLVELDWAARPVPSVKFDAQLHLDDFGGQKLSPFAQQLELIRLGMKHQRGQVFVATPPYIDRTKLGASGSYHTLGHRAVAHKTEFEEMLGVEQHLMDGFSDFITNLKNDGVLDDTIVLFMGAYSSPGVHRRENLPIVLAGGGFRHQGLVDCVRNGALQHPLSHLYVSILHQLGLDIDQFGPDRGNVDKLIG